MSDEKKIEGNKKLNVQKKSLERLKQKNGKSISKLSQKEQAELLEIICQWLGLADENGNLFIQ
jgi:hypothetical protein